MCGRSFSKNLKNLQQASYPFVTKIHSLSGIRSSKDGNSYRLHEYFSEFCPLCYLIGVCEWGDSGMIYRTLPGKHSYVFLPHKENLMELYRFKKEYSVILNNGERWSNIKVRIHTEDIEMTPGKYSTLLCFYEKLCIDVGINPEIAPRWSLIEIPQGVQLKNIKLADVGIKMGILSLLKQLSDKDEPIRVYDDIIKGLYFFQEKPAGSRKDNNITDQLRERLSEGIMQDDFRTFVREFLPKKGGTVGFSGKVRENIETLIYLWRWKKMGIPKEKLDTIKSVGNIVAKSCKGNLSLLYKLDKTRNLEEFWSVLREISRKLLGLDEKDREYIKVTSLDDLIYLVKEHENLWKEIRDLLVVYSSMYYSIGSRKGGEKE